MFMHKIFNSIIKWYLKTLMCLGFYISIFSFLGLAPSTLFAFQITDDSGQILSLDRYPQRIISLAPHITETIFYIGQGDKLVGVDQFSNYPNEALQIPRICNSNQLNIEEILKLKPDLVIAWESGNTAPQLARLKEFNIPIYYSEPRNLEGIKKTILQFGLLTDAPTQSRNKALTFQNKLAKIQKGTKKITSKKKIRVFYQVWQQPLMTLNGEHVVSEVIELCGGINIFSELKILAPLISTEAVIAANPQLIITGEQSLAQLEMWNKWPRIEAVKNQNFLGINSDHLVRAGPRILLGAEKICESIYAIEQ